MVALGRSRGRWRAAVEGFSLAVVPGLIALRLFPHVLEELGVIAFALAGAGYLALRLADRHHDPAHAHDGRRASAVGVAIVLPALLAHAFSDGAALAIASATGGRAHVGPELAGALVLHRLPEGMFLATALVPSVGWNRTLRRLAAMGLATVLGALLGESLLRSVPDAIFDGVMAFGLGAMLRLAVHAHDQSAEGEGAGAISGGAFLVGAAALLRIPDPHSILDVAHPQELSFARAAVALFIESSPAVVFGVVVAAGVRSLRRPLTGSHLAVSGRWHQAAQGVLHGLASPMCSCGAAPAAQRLLSKGAPLAAVLSFVVAAPEMDLGAIALAQGLLGHEVTLARLALGAVTALLVGALIGGSEAPGALVDVTHERSKALHHNALRATDQVAAWFVLGIVAAATLEAAVSPGALARVPPVWSYAFALVVAMPMYLAPHASIPVAAVLIHKGLGIGPAVAMVMGAAGANSWVLRVLAEARGRVVALRFGASILVASASVGLLVERLAGADRVPEVHDLAAHHHGVVETGAALLLGLLLAGSVLRSGPRQWFKSLQPGGDPHGH